MLRFITSGLAAFAVAAVIIGAPCLIAYLSRDVGDAAAGLALLCLCIFAPIIVALAAKA